MTKRTKEEVLKQRSSDGEHVRAFGYVMHRGIEDAEYREICDAHQRKAEGDGTGGSTEFKKDRFITFVASSESVDSYGDILRVAGCDLTRYKNGASAFITSHDLRNVSGSCGVIVKAWKANNIEGVPEGKAVMVTVYFPTAEEDPDADYVFKKYKAGTLNAVSVGFSIVEYFDPPQDSKERKELGLGKWGIEVRKWKPFELSAVTVGANPDALQRKSIEEKRIESLEKTIENLAQKIDELMTSMKSESNAGKLNASKVRTYFEQNPIQVAIK